MIVVQKISTPLLRQLPLVVAIALAGLSPLAVHAQPNPEIANCMEIKDEDTLTQVNVCTAHSGCAFVFAIHKTCVKAKQFINNLKTAIGDGVQGLFGRNKDITPDAIFEASLSEKARVLDKESELKEMTSSIRTSVRGAQQGTLNGERDGNSWVYYGDVKDNRRDGAGTTIFSTGAIVRGQWAADSRVGPGELLIPNEVRRVGVAARGFNGIGGEAKEDGSFAVGRFRNGELEEGKFVQANGIRQEGRFKDNRMVEGKGYRADGSLRHEGRFENGQLLFGKEYDSMGIATEVNKPRDRELAAVANQEVEERRRVAALAERETADQRRRDEDARATQNFKENLKSMNAGQLFAKADELSAQGDKIRAREVLRALVSRYPDHALAGSAAQQLSGGSGTGSTTTQLQLGGSSTPARRSSSQVSKCFPSETEITEMERLSALVPGKSPYDRSFYAGQDSTLSKLVRERKSDWLNNTLRAQKGNIGHYEFKLQPNYRSESPEDDRKLLFHSRVMLKMVECHINNPDASANPSVSSAGGACASRADATGAEFERRFAMLSSNNRIGQLGMIYSINKTLSEIWAPCDAAKAQSYKDTANSTLRTCSAIATTPSVCTPNINW